MLKLVLATTTIAASTTIAAANPTPMPPPAPDPPVVVSAPEVTQPTPQLHVFAGYDLRHNTVAWGAAFGDRGLSPDEFLRTVGRTDLADDVRRRKHIAIAAELGALAMAGVTIYEFVQTRQMGNWTPCFSQTTQAGLNMCTANADAAAQQADNSHVAPLLLAGAATVGLAAIAAYELLTAPRISASEAAALAARYNATHVIPYATPDGAGVSLQGRF